MLKCKALCQIIPRLPWGGHGHHCPPRSSAPAQGLCRLPPSPGVHCHDGLPRNPHTPGPIWSWRLRRPPVSVVKGRGLCTPPCVPPLDPQVTSHDCVQNSPVVNLISPLRYFLLPPAPPPPPPWACLRSHLSLWRVLCWFCFNVFFFFFGSHSPVCAACHCSSCVGWSSPPPPQKTVPHFWSHQTLSARFPKSL